MFVALPVSGMPESLRFTFPLFRRLRPPAGAGRSGYWGGKEVSLLRELAEVVAAIGAVTLAGWHTPLTFEEMGHLYLLTVMVLSLRVSRWPALVAALATVLVWNYAYVPPRFAFAKPGLNDGLLVTTYVGVALAIGQLTSHIRNRERTEQQRERHARALFNLTRALAGARTLDEGIALALRQADELFEAQTALLLPEERGELVPHPAGSLVPDAPALALAAWTRRNRHEGGRFTTVSPEAPALHLPLLRAGRVLGVLVVRPPAGVKRSTPQQRDLLDAFAAQIALLIERERLRSVDERNKLLAESDRLHRTLLDSVSHELRTPLAVLRAAAENLARDEGARRVELSAEIIAATDRLNRMVANLLGQSRLEAGVIKPKLDWCDARDVIAAARRNLGDALARHAVRVTLDAGFPLLRADAPLLEQVVTNLLLNAAHYSPAGGTITVGGGLAEDGAHVRLTVADEGPGIPPALRPQLFQKFSRSDAVRGGGLGLGLSIARGFMQAQGGDLMLEESAGPGARFTLQLPHFTHTLVPHE